MVQFSGHAYTSQRVIKVVIVQGRDQREKGHIYGFGRVRMPP